MVKRKISTNIIKRKLTFEETEIVLKARIQNYFGFKRIEYIKENRWRNHFGKSVSTHEAWELMDFYQRPLPF